MIKIIYVIFKLLNSAHEIERENLSEDDFYSEIYAIAVPF